MESEKEKFEKIVRCFRAAIKKMADLSIPPITQNYTIWYEYYSQTNLLMNKELDGLIAFNQPFTPVKSREIYKRYFDASPNKKLDELRKAVQKLIGQLSVQLTELVGDMDIYEEVLSSCETDLKENLEITALNKLISTLLEETRKARSSSQSTNIQVAQLNAEIKSMHSAIAELSEENLIDPLTGIGNRRAFDETLENILLDGKNESGESFTFCLLMLDIDHFKKFNDTHGHLAGDGVLRYVAQIIKKHIKGQDLVARYGGEEFSVILPNTEYYQGEIVAQSLVDIIAKRSLTAGKEKRPLGNVTASIGLAEYRLNDVAASIIDRADKCLYSAKSQGRNQVVGDKTSKSSKTNHS
ncbi:MAG: GGDEF domain-containing protein [SAR86 cluster bacterium]|uniref:diguanylate cyclase n=1 Tax=SAR86 cluster bacterium TaxID=2030880 RepID=A0A2A4MWJ6_9GAMM|nr:MAG: GGDEF domain-containing protein [SAR86 cluster bacterium]